jgi:outer membrane protein
MKNKLSSVVLKALPVVLMATFAASASAQKAGDNVISAGWMHLKPFDSSKPVQVTSPTQRTLDGSGSTVGPSDTLGIAYTRFLTDNLSVTADAGIPPKFTLTGTGTLGPVGKIGTANQLSPAVLLKWHFLESNAKIRPFVGVGATYVWYDNIKTTDRFQQYISNAMSGGATTAGRTSIELESSFAPVLNAGVTYAIDDKWSLNFSASYIPLKTTAKLTTVMPTNAVVKSETKLTLNPLVTFLSVGYKF